MKLIKLMLSACVAALAFVSCNKEEGPAIKDGYKSVEIEISNLFQTKSMGQMIEDESVITLQNLRIYLTDGTNIYFNAMDEAGTTLTEAAYQFAPSAAAPLPETISYHFVDPKVNKVVAIANLTDAQYATIKTYEDIKKLILSIDTQQDPDFIALYDESGLTATGSQHVPEKDTHKVGANEITNVYKATLNLVPRVARFELDGFAIKFSDDKPIYNTITINKVAFNNYYYSVALYNGVEEAVSLDCGAEQQVNAINYLSSITLGAEEQWYGDVLDGGLTIIRPATVAAGGSWVNEQIKDSEGNPYALYYHMFPLDSVEPEMSGYPELMFQLAATDLAGNTTATYIYTKSFKNESGDVITEFEEGKIYRMNIAGITDGEGDLPFKEEDIEQLARCLDITVTVDDWNVILVTPEF